MASKKKKIKSNEKIAQKPRPRSEEPETIKSVLEQLEEMKGVTARLAQEREEKQQLQTIIEDLRATKGDEENLSEEENTIPQPRGTAGADWSLQIEMGLATSPTNFGKYKALLRGIRDLVLNANINWEIGWKDIPPSDKAKMFQVARERYPILKCYANDWATAEMAKQYIKNKRAHYYNNGWLPVPEKYAYLKENASKRNATGSRVKRAKAQLAAKKRTKQNKANKVKNMSRQSELESSGAEEDEDSNVE